MRIRWGRIIVAAIGVEAAAIAVLVVLVACFGPREAAAARDFAERLGQWVGPIAGAVFCFLGGLWAAQRPVANGSFQGLLVGVAAAVIDVALLAAAGAPFQLLFVGSNLAKALAGWLGGLTEFRRERPTGSHGNGAGVV